MGVTSSSRSANGLSKTMLNKQRFLVISKCDIGDGKLIDKISKEIGKKIPFIFISSITNIGLDELKDKIWSMLNSSYD